MYNGILYIEDCCVYTGVCCVCTEVGKRAGVLVSANATNILFQVIYREAEDQLSSEDTMMLAHYVLGKLAQKGVHLALILDINASYSFFALLKNVRPTDVVTTKLVI